MRPRGVVLAVALGAALLVTAALPALAVVPGQAQRVTKSASGAQLSAGGWAGAISSHGLRATFVSAAAVISGVPGGVNNVYARDASTNAVTCVSAGVGGGGANDRADQPSISSDGKLIAFSSYATNLVSGDGNGVEDVFLRRIEAGTTERVSVTAGGGETDGDSYAPALSADGRWLAFVSRSSGVASATGSHAQVYVRDLQAGRTTRVSRSAGGGETGADASWPSISSDGRFVCYETTAAGVVAGLAGGSRIVYRYDHVTGTTIAVSLAADGDAPAADCQASSLSADGSRVAYESAASDIVDGDTNGRFDVFVRDIDSGTTVRASLRTGTAQANDRSSKPSISADGRFVAFQSRASDLVANDLNAAEDVFVRDLSAGTTTRVSVKHGGSDADGESLGPAISPDGRFVAFSSYASDIVADDTNTSPDAFVREVVPRDVERLAGPDRYGTAVAASRRAFTGTVPALVVATGRNFPDALGGAGLAGVGGGPVLLTQPTSLPATVTAEVRRLDPARVYVLGSTAAVSADVVTSLEELVGAGNVTRIGGGDRYATAQLVGAAVAAADGFDGVVYVATGANYPDALAVSPIAAARRRPVALVAPTAAGAPALPAGTKRAVVLGSAAAVSQAVSDDLEARLGSSNVTRIGGADRYETAAAIAAEGVAEGLAFDGVALATGADFPDALSGGPVCARLGSVMLLTRPTSLPAASAAALTAHASAIARARVLGGPPAVAESVVTAVRTAVGE